MNNPRAVIDGTSKGQTSDILQRTYEQDERNKNGKVVFPSGDQQIGI